MKAVILAAGKGTRMKDLTRDIPKPMVPVNGRPMLEYIVEGLRTAGVVDIGLVVGYLQETVRGHFGDGGAFGVRVTYIEQPVQNGTGAALDLARDFTRDDAFFFTFGDVLTAPENYPGMVSDFTGRPCEALLGLNVVDDPYRGAAVYLDESGAIIRMVEKPPQGASTTNLVNAGLMVLTPEVFSHTSRLTLSPRGEYELTDVFGMYREEGRLMRGYPLAGFWRDVGTPEDLASMNRDLQ